METINLSKLYDPFDPARIEWKPGSVTKDGKRALGLAYADIRAYMERLDEVFGPGGWEVTYSPWRDDRMIATVSAFVNNQWVRKSSTGELDASNRSGNDGTVIEAQAFKRACVMWGIGRYLYDFPSPWVDYDSAAKAFSGSGKAALDKMVNDQYNRAMGKPVPKQAPPSESPVSLPRQQEQEDDAKLLAMAQAQGDNPFDPNWSTGGDMLDAIADLQIADPKTDVGRMVDYLRGLDVNSAVSLEHNPNGKRGFTPYSKLAAELDKRYGKDSHNAILTALLGNVTNKEHLPGEDVSILTEWLTAPDQNTKKLEILDTFVILLGAHITEEKEKEQHG